MQVTRQQVESITRAVLRELASREQSLATAPVAPTAPSTAPIVCAHRVITEDSLQQLDAANRTVAVAAGAVITPSGRDFIRKHQVTISNQAESAGTTAGTVITIDDCRSLNAATEAAGWQLVSADCEADAAKKAAAASHQRIICCGGEPSVTACYINRRPHLRAAVVSAETNLESLLESMNPQVLCLSATGTSFVFALRLLRTLSGRSLDAPAEWREVKS